MTTPTSDMLHLATTSRQLAQRLLTIGENRLELLAIEMQEEREHLLHVLLLLLAMAVFGLLAGMALTAVVVVMLWPYAPVAVLLGLAATYGVIAVVLGRWATALLRGWRSFPASLDQLRKDLASFDSALS